MTLFENHKAALVFAGVTLFGAAIFVESRSASEPKDIEVANKVEPREQKPAEVSTSSETQLSEWYEGDEPVIDDFVPDDELIDEANGFDPTPEYVSPEESSVVETVIVRQANNRPPAAGERSYRDNGNGPRMVPGKPKDGGGGPRQPIVARQDGR